MTANYQERFLHARRNYIAAQFQNLNEMQRQAVLTTEGPLLLLAGAGSGKTTVMVEKILRYLEYGNVTKVIVLTFTRASAADMREKLTERLSDAVRLGGERALHYKEQLKLLPFAYIGTIDSICGQIFKRYLFWNTC